MQGALCKEDLDTSSGSARAEAMHEQESDNKGKTQAASDYPALGAIIEDKLLLALNKAALCTKKRLLQGANSSVNTRFTNPGANLNATLTQQGEARKRAGQSKTTTCWKKAEPLGTLLGL